MKKILVIIPTPTYGGPHNRITRLNELMKVNGWEYVVVIPKEEGSCASKLREKGVNVREIELFRPRSTLNLFTNLKFILSFVKQVNTIRKIIRNENVELVQLSGLMNLQGAVASKLEYKPIVWQLLGNFYPYWIRRVLSPLIIFMSSIIMVTGRQIANEHPGIENKSKVIFFYSPVDIELFKRNNSKRIEVRHKLGISDDSFVVGTIGNQNKPKGHENLVEVANLFKNDEKICFVVIGSKTPSHIKYYQKYVIDKVKKYELDIQKIFHIEEPRFEIHDYLSAFDLFILTSYKEGIPTVILEAMSSGLPIISSDVGAIKEIVKKYENGFLHKYYEYEKFKESINILRNDQNLYHKMSICNRTTAEEKFAASICAELHISCYEYAIRINNK
jgi:glycosyltransferase involved in cell wall biosynthesis